MTVGIKTYQHTQAVAASSWTVTHSLGLKPVSDVFVNESGVMTKILPMKVIHLNDNTMTIEFSIARSGIARLIGF